MVHALADFVQERARDKSWGPTDLARESGLSKQLCSNWLNDGRDRMSRLPLASTIDGFVKAFRVPKEFLLGKAIESLDLGYSAGDFVNSVATASDRELLDEIEDRLKKRGGERDSGSSSNTPDDPDQGGQVIKLDQPRTQRPAARTTRRPGSTDEPTD